MNAKKVCMIVLCILLLQGISKNTKAQTFQWAKQMGGIGHDYSFSMKVDGSGNVYTTGCFYGTVDFDPGSGVYNLTSAVAYDMFISKLDASGNFVWVKQMRGVENNISYSIELDDSGNIYTTGRFLGTVDFDPGVGVFNLTSVGDVDIFISKLDASGNFIWAKQMGGATDDFGTSIAVDGCGNIYTTGCFLGLADFDPGIGTFNLPLAVDYDIFISKLDASGNFVWAKKLGGMNQDWSYSIALDDSGNIYTTGYFYGTADFDPGPGTFNFISAGYYDIFISKLNAIGDFVWAKQMGGTSGDDIGYSVVVDGNGNIYTTGFFQGTVDFDPGPGIFNLSSTGGYNIYISKLSALGNFMWAKQIGGGTNSGGEGHSLIVDINGNIYSTGQFWGTVDFDPGVGVYNLTGAGNTYISKLDASGNFLWAKQMEGINGDYSTSIALNVNGDVYTTGFFKGTVDFYPEAETFNLTSAGGYDIFIQKMSQSVNILEEQLPSMKLYPIPTNGILTLDLGSVYSNIQLIVRNELGQEIVRNSFVSKSKLDFMIPGKAGMYFVELNLDNNNKSLFKVIKE